MAYLIVSLIAGFAVAAVGVFGFCAGLGACLMLYVAGCWAGFAIALAVALLGRPWRKPPLTSSLADPSRAHLPGDLATRH